jgi:sulfide:quinone oxidoreductase
MLSDSSRATSPLASPDRLRVIVAGGGVAGLETVLALADLAPGLLETTLIAPNDEFVYRPMVVREPFANGAARRYPLEPIVSDAGATLLHGELGWIDPVARTIHTEAGEALEYDALVLALGAKVTECYPHALTIDDRDMDETFHGLIQDVEGDFIHKLAFVMPARIAWPLPLYELALMMAARAYDMQIELETTIVTPEQMPLAIFGDKASRGVAELLGAAKIETITSAHAEVPSYGEVLINQGERRLEVDRVIALPELSGPIVRGIPLGEDSFIPVDEHCRVRDVERIYAAGDATDFPIKMGGVGAQQADVIAQSIAALAGASVTPERFDPTVRAILLTGEKPRYLSAHDVGGRGFDSEISAQPAWSPSSKIAAKYLAPYLQAQDRKDTSKAGVAA